LDEISGAGHTDRLPFVRAIEQEAVFEPPPVPL
jgi:hypothetical protein